MFKTIGRKGAGVALAGAVAVLGGATVAPAQAEPGSSFPGDGTYVVGSDIRPGIYVSPASDGCYWERLSGLSGTLSDIIANGSSVGQQYVQIASTDVAFSTSGCSTWTSAGAAPGVAAPRPPVIVNAPTPIPDGTPGLRPGDPCSDPAGVAQDGIGQTMWCNPLMTGDHSLRWMYGGPE